MVAIPRSGKPTLPHRETGGIDLEAGKEFLRQRSVTQAAPFIADDFDAPLTEDVLLKQTP